MLSSSGTPKTLFAVILVPLGTLLFAKSVRMDRKHDHDILMRAKFHADFMERGNAFSTHIRERVHQSLRETVDPLWEKDRQAVLLRSH